MITTSDKITFSENTNESVKLILTAAINNGKRQRVRLFFGDPETGKDWGDENDVMGYIGLSMGPVRIPLLIANTRSLGGLGISTNSIVKIVDTHTYRVLWQHPAYKCPVYWVGDSAPDVRVKGYVSSVFKDGEVYANCRSFTQAAHLMLFLQGKRFSK